MPLDTSIARSIKPLQVQFRDLGADYNQLAQMQSAESQNQLAQMQMQEARQLAPLRMQEQQSRAAAAKLTLDEANEAKTIVDGIMAKVAEFPDAPQNPFQAAKEMFNSSNATVRAGGEKFLKSLQILQAFENQMANERAYAEDQRGGAPAVVASGSVDNVAAPMVASGVMLGGYPPQRDVTNAMAPEVADAPPVNAMAKKAVNPLQDAAALMKQIQDGDDRFARGGTPAPGWKNKRELLVKAFEQAVKVERNQNQRYLSLGAGAALDTETRELIARDRPPAAAAAPKIFSVRGIPHTLNEEGNLEPLTVEGGAALAPAAAVAATPKIINIKGVPHTLNDAGNLVLVPVEGGALPAAVAVKPQAVAAARIINIKGVPHTLNEDGNLVPVPVEGGALPAAAVKPQAAPATRIINIKGVPHTLNAEGNLVPVPVEGGALPAAAAAVQPQAAPKITTIKGIPYTFNATTGKFVRVPVEGGVLPAASKGRTLPSTDAGGGVKPAIGIKPLTEAQAIKRRDTVGKEFKSATSALQTTQDVLDSIAFVKAEPGLARATGFTGTMLPSFPEGAAASADVRLANVKGKVTALGKAAAAASGAIGSIATVEWKILSDQIAAIDPVKGTGPLLAQLDLVEQQAQGAMSRIRDGYERQFGEDFERFPQFSNLPPPKSAVKPKTPEAPAKPTAAQGTGGFKYLGKERK